MKFQRLQHLAGILTEANHENDDYDAQEEAMMKELHPIKDRLEAIMKKYPHAEWDDVLDWLKS